MTFMMLDADVVACSPASVYRVLKKAGLLAGQTPNVTKKGTGYVQPLKPHQEWHVDVSYLNIAGTFYFLCCVLDGYSRFIVHWEIREKMEEIDVETILQRARECHPGVTPRIITDNGPQFIAKDFKEFIRIAGMTHVRTSPYYPQTNGKIERWHKTIKGDCIRVKVPLSLEEARRIVADYVQHYNHVRLHSAIGYVTPNDRLLGNDEAIHAERDRKLAEARERRKEHAANPARTAAEPAPTVASGHRLRRRACRHHHRPGAGPARLRAPLRSRRPATRRLSLARLRPTAPPAASASTPTPTRFHCFKCNRSGNALDLWAAANRLSPYDAALDLCQRLNIPLPLLTPPTTAATREEETVAICFKHLYNPLSVSEDAFLYPLTRTLAIFQFRLNHYTSSFRATSWT